MTNIQTTTIKEMTMRRTILTIMMIRTPYSNRILTMIIKIKEIYCTCRTTVRNQEITRRMNSTFSMTTKMTMSSTTKTNTSSKVKRKTKPRSILLILSTLANRIPWPEAKS
jgi:hypothetical protein